MSSSVKPRVLLAFPFALFTSPGLFPLDESQGKPTFPDFYFHFSILFCHSCPTQGCHWSPASGALWSFFVRLGQHGLVVGVDVWSFFFGVSAGQLWRMPPFSCFFTLRGQQATWGNTICYFFFSLDGQEITGMVMNGTAFFIGVWLAVGGLFFLFFYSSDPYGDWIYLDFQILWNEGNIGKGRPDGGSVRAQSNLRRYPREVEYLTYGTYPWGVRQQKFARTRSSG